MRELDRAARGVPSLNKKRVSTMPSGGEYDAKMIYYACIIQSKWRGFYYRSVSFSAMLPLIKAADPD